MVEKGVAKGQCGAEVKGLLASGSTRGPQLLPFTTALPLASTASGSGGDVSCFEMGDDFSFRAGFAVVGSSNIPPRIDSVSVSER